MTVRALLQKATIHSRQHAAVLEGDVYRWGRLDPGGKAGLSALVTFRADGSQPDVQVLFFPRTFDDYAA